MQNTATDSNTSRLLYLFLLTHLIGWTLIPALVRHNLPLDAVEAAIWGHQLDWGYDKNPFFIGWLAGLATSIGKPSDWIVYLFSQLSVVACLWSVWLLAKRMVPPAYALLSVLMLEGIQYYTFHAIDFNDNTLELGLWGFTIYFFYRATLQHHSSSCQQCPPCQQCPSCQRRLASTTPSRKMPAYAGMTDIAGMTKNADWLLTGLFAGLGVMTKYYTLALLAGMCLFLLLDKNNRKQLTTLPPWLSACIFMLILLPHIMWLPQHDFITIRYVIKRATNHAVPGNHIFYPVEFAWQQLQVFLSGALLLILFLLGKRPVLAAERHTLSNFNRRFLFYVGLCPFLLTLLLSFCLNIKLRAGWGMPLQSLWGIMLVMLLQPTITEKKSLQALVITLTLMCAMWITYAISIFYSTDTATANFPGRKIAAQITKEWHARYGTSLTYLAGSRWAGGNVALYSPDKPAVMINWDRQRSPWINRAEMEKNGAVFIWDITDHEKLPDEVRHQFPRLGKSEVMEYNWRFNRSNLPRGKIGVAYLPPKDAAT